MKFIYILLALILVTILIILYGLINSASSFGLSLKFSNEYISIVLEMINMVVGLFAVTLTIGSIQKFRQSNFGHVLLYFTFGTFLLSLIRLFLLLNEVSILPLTDETVAIGWHIMFYCSAGCFLLGVINLYQFTKEKIRPISMQSAYTSGSLLTATAIIIFLSAKLFDNVYQTTLQSNMLYNFGLHHFLAFIFAGLIAIYLWKTKKQSPNFRLIINAFLWGFVFLSLIHAWELLTESWHLIPIAEEIGEHIEQIITIIAYAFIAKAYMQDLPIESTTQIPNPPLTPPTTPTMSSS